MNNLYLVENEAGTTTLINALSISDCILMLAEADEIDTTKFKTKFKTCESLLDYVFLYNRYSGCHIKNIYKISEVCYSQGDM